jgi:epoxyqueuosine reductase
LPDDFKPRALPDLYQTAILDDAAYQRYFGGSPMTRAKRGGLRRNALIALAVGRDPRLPQALEQARRDPEPPLPETVAQIERYLALPQA